MLMVEEEELEAGLEEMVLKGLVVAGAVLPPCWSSSMVDNWTCMPSVACPSQHCCAVTMNTGRTL
jgi:hypothetical protein